MSLTRLDDLTWRVGICSAAAANPDLANEGSLVRYRRRRHRRGCVGNRLALICLSSQPAVLNRSEKSTCRENLLAEPYNVCRGVGHYWLKGGPLVRPKEAK